MIEIKKENDGTTTITGIDEAELMTMFMFADSCRRQIPATPPLAEEAGKFMDLVKEYWRVKGVVCLF